MPKNLRLILAPVAKVFASEDDFTPEVLAKLRHNIKHLQMDYLVFDSDMNINEGCQSDVWTMLNSFYLKTLTGGHG